MDQRKEMTTMPFALLFFYFFSYFSRVIYLLCSSTSDVACLCSSSTRPRMAPGGCAPSDHAPAGPALAAAPPRALPWWSRPQRALPEPCHSSCTQQTTLLRLCPSRPAHVRFLPCAHARSLSPSGGKTSLFFFYVRAHFLR